MGTSRHLPEPIRACFAREMVAVELFKPRIELSRRDEGAGGLLVVQTIGSVAAVGRETFVEDRVAPVSPLLHPLGVAPVRGSLEHAVGTFQCVLHVAFEHVAVICQAEAVLLDRLRVSIDVVILKVRLALEDLVAIQALPVVESYFLLVLRQGLLGKGCANGDSKQSSHNQTAGAGRL
eukprot:765610-Hanusia_phi.AAC.4